MENAEVVAAVNAIFLDQFELEEAELTPDKKIFQDLGLDSLDMVDLMVGLQRSMGIALRHNEEVRKVETLGDIYALCAKLLEQNPELLARFKERN